MLSIPLGCLPDDRVQQRPILALGAVVDSPFESSLVCTPRIEFVTMMEGVVLAIRIGLHFVTQLAWMR